MPRLRCLFVLLIAGHSIAFSDSARPAPAPRRAGYAETRRLLEAGAFERALRELGARPVQEVERDREALTLRGLAQWGAGLDRFSTLAVQVGRLELISRVKQLAARSAREHPPGTDIGDRLARALPELDAAVHREGQAVGEVGRIGDESCAALSMAEADFSRARRLPALGRARWCEAPERWLLLARAHRFSVERARAEWGRDITGTGLSGLTTPERQKREQQLQALENSFLVELDGQLEGSGGKPAVPPTLHAAADALLVFGFSSQRITRWLPAEVPHSLAVPGLPILAKAPIREVRELVTRDSAQAVIQLYRHCAEPREGATAADTAYTNYLIEMQSCEVTLTRLAALAGELRPQAVAGNPLLQLERARLLSRQEGQEESVRNVLSQLGAGQLRRPVWTAAPAPIRAAFLRLPQWLRYGRQVSVSFKSLLDKHERSLRATDPPAMQVELQQLRLALGTVLTTSDLPWDRETGYEMAMSALSRLEKLPGVLAPEQVARYAGLRGRLEAAAKQERIPAQVCVVLSDGRIGWVTEPTDLASISNPLVLVHRDGLTLTPPFPR